MKPYVCIMPCHTPQTYVASTIALSSQIVKATQVTPRNSGARMKRVRKRLKRARSPYARIMPGRWCPSAPNAST